MGELNVGDLLAWWNLTFLLPMIAGIALALVASIGVSDGDGGVDADAEAGVEAEVDADFEGDADAAGDVDVDGDGAIEASDGLLNSLFGGGRVALVLQLTLLSLSFGAIGWGCNRALAAFMPVFFPVSLAVASLGATLSSRALGRLAARHLPRDESYGAPFSSLAGCTGTVASLTSADEGWVHVTDPSGNFIEAHACGHGGARLHIGAAVVIVEVVLADRVCLVAELENTNEEETS